ncbi:MAG TPA: hypothetical protein VHC49_23725 [Mycobacteriales bacterium]|nr:hypothetical protein [Mycobacteriales bacterium]
MNTYRVLWRGRVIRWQSRRNGVAVVAVALFAVTLVAAMALSRPPAIGAREAPAEGQTAVGYAGGRLSVYGQQRAVPIGSLAKVMTAYVVLRDHPLFVGGNGPTLTVDEAAEQDYRSRRPSGQSLLKVQAGDRLTERQAIEALMVPSANNIADLVAIWDAGSIGAFVAEMNATARGMGLAHTHYADPSGYSPGTVSTALDQTRLAEWAVKIPELAAAASLRSADFPRASNVRNYNALLGTDGVFGLKTGTTDQAGGNVVFAAHRHGRLIVGAVLGQKIGASTRESLSVAFGIAAYLIESLT